MGQELAAEPMLQSLYQSLFAPYEQFYTQNDYLRIRQYFDCHLDGTEERHALDTYQIAVHLSESQKNADLVMEGALRFLNLQAALWDDLYDLLKKLSPNSLT